MAHDHAREQKQTALRAKRLAMLLTRGGQLASKLDGQGAEEVCRSRKLSDSGVKARIFHEVADAHLSKIIKVDQKSDLFTFDIAVKALGRAQMMDANCCWSLMWAIWASSKSCSALLGDDV